MAMLFAFSAQPTVPRLPDELSYYHVHFSAYAGLAVLTVRALARGLREVSWRAVAGAVIISSLYGLSDEYHQSFVPGRHADALDMAADAIGSVAGAGAAGAWSIIRRRL